MTAHDPKIRKGRKFDQVIEGARQVFMTDGFEGASVDDIARAAGVSKATLYSYFPDKRLLFSEVARQQCRAQAELALHEIDMTAPPRQVLTQAGVFFLSFLTSEAGVSMFRTCVAECDRFPDIGRQFYESGPGITLQLLIGYLQQATGRGELKINDFDMAACQFAQLCKGHIWIKATLGVETKFDQDEIALVVDAAVDTFMARFGP